jgi:hypothetical protein
VETCQADEYCRTGAMVSTCRIIPFTCAVPATCDCVEGKGQGQGGQGGGQGCSNASCTDTDGQIRLTCQ